MACVELPKDAEGREIPRKTEVMYDANGKKVHIISFTYKCDVFGRWSQWKVFSPDIRGEKDGMLPADSLYLTPPDSLKQLNEDLSRVANFKIGGDFSSPACAYTGSAADSCDVCKFRDLNGTCSLLALKDIASRVNRLCGDAE